METIEGCYECGRFCKEGWGKVEGWEREEGSRKGKMGKRVVWKTKNSEGGLMELADGEVSREMKTKMRAKRLWAKREGK